MFSRIHDKMGTAGLVVAVVALVAALGGAAFAAGGLTKSQEKQVKKLIKQYKKPGPTGPQGAQGPQGAAGAPGAKGATGAEGKQGTPGKDGTNGVDGEDGACSAGNPECVLPPRATLTGEWVAASVSKYHESFFAISYPLRIVPPPQTGAKFYIPKGGSPTPECPGSFHEPKAEPGYLCIYAKQEEGEGKEISEPFFGGNPDDTSGAIIEFIEPKLPEGGPRAWGSWAATAHCTEEEEEEGAPGC